MCLLNAKITKRRPISGSNITCPGIPPQAVKFARLPFIIKITIGLLVDTHKATIYCRTKSGKIEKNHVLYMELPHYHSLLQPNEWSLMWLKTRSINFISAFANEQKDDMSQVLYGASSDKTQCMTSGEQRLVEEHLRGKRWSDFRRELQLGAHEAAAIVTSTGVLKIKEATGIGVQTSPCCIKKKNA